jgi:pilus assembly protein Flp/PilA
MAKEFIMLYLPREDGQGLVEYALILLLVALVVIVIVAIFGQQLINAFSQVVGCFGPAGSRPPICS